MYVLRKAMDFLLVIEVASGLTNRQWRRDFVHYETPAQIQSVRADNLGAARPTILVLGNHHLPTVEAQDRAIPQRHPLGGAADVVADEGATETICRPVGTGAMHQTAVEEQDVTGG
jgi:hypothetical protein